MRIRSLLKWLAIAVGSLIGIALLAVATIYVLIGVDLHRTFEIAGTNVVVPGDDASIAEGERLARLRGCSGGCHGETINGEVFFDAPDGTIVVAPDLALAARNYSTQELERIIRHGVRPDGTSVILPMPSSMFYNLNDEDLGAIIAYLQTQEPGALQQRDSRVGPLGRLLFFYFKQEEGSILSAEVIDHDAPRISSSVHETAAHGHYLAKTLCTECHGEDLRGGGDGFAPTLAIVAAYDIENFSKLMRTGVPVGDRELDLMADVAVSRFSHFSDQEISSLHAYLQTLAATAPIP